VPPRVGVAPPGEARAPRAVADVNVLVSAVRTPNGLCGRLLEAAIDGRWQPVISMMLFEELEDVLARLKFREVLGQETADRFLAGLLAVAEWAPDPEGAHICCLMAALCARRMLFDVVASIACRLSPVVRSGRALGVDGGLLSEQACLLY
jgi:PIN domain